MITEKDKTINTTIALVQMIDHVMNIMVEADSKVHRMMVRKIFIDDVTKLLKGGDES